MPIAFRNIDGKFALRLNIKQLKESTNCAEIRQYSTKAVSYSREVSIRGKKLKVPLT
jgi:hypothetical protein